MNWENLNLINIVETFIGALFAFLFGLLTQFLSQQSSEKIERNKRVKIFFLFVQSNQNELNKISSILDKCLNSDNIRKSISENLCSSNNDIWIYSIKGDYIKVSTDLLQSRCNEDVIQKTKKIVQIQEKFSREFVKKCEEYSLISDDTHDRATLECKILMTKLYIADCQKKLDEIRLPLKKLGFWKQFEGQ